MPTPSLFPPVSTLTKCLFAALLLSPSMAMAGQVATLTNLRSFSGVTPSGEESGVFPVSAPFKASDGNFYGIVGKGGTFGNGVIYKRTPAGVNSILHNFHDDEFSSPLIAEGNEPRVLIEGADHNLYGVCNDGGKNDDNVNFNGGGTIFKITLPGGAYTKLYDFDVGNVNVAPVNPVALIQGKDGNFYGLTTFGGKDTNGSGAFFKFVAGTKTFTTLYQFVNTNSFGVEPKAQLLLAKDGNLYGTTTNSGGTDPNARARGTIFRITTAGVPTLVHAFASDPNNPDNQPPQPDTTPLIQGTDSFVYGASRVGGGEDYGTVYRCTTAGGSFKILHAFEDEASDGAYPFGGLVQAPDGNLYGGTQFGFGPSFGNPGNGGYFQVTTAGVFTSLYKFPTADDTTAPAQAASRLTVVSPGTFYGQTGDGANGLGALIRLIVSPAVKGATTATGTVGVAFSYKITATNNPTSYAAVGLPTGLTVDSKTGIISGKPTKAGTFKVTLKAANGGGVGTAVLTLTVKAQ